MKYARTLSSFDAGSQCWLFSIAFRQPGRLTRCLFGLPDNLHARVFFVRLDVGTQQAAIFFLQRVAVGEQTLIRLF